MLSVKIKPLPAASVFTNVYLIIHLAELILVNLSEIHFHIAISKCVFSKALKQIADVPFC